MAGTREREVSAVINCIWVVVISGVVLFLFHNHFKIQERLRALERKQKDDK
jgi:hypothetical protein